MIVRSTLVGTMKQCFRKANYRYMEGLRLKGAGVSGSLAFGTAVHTAIAILHMQGKATAFSYLDAIKWVSTKKTRGHAKALLSRYAKEYTFDEYSAGQRFSFTFGRHEWRGCFDALAVFHGSLWVVEYKTTLPYFLRVKPNDQFISYYIGAVRSGYEVSGVLVINLDAGTLTVRRRLVTYTDIEVARWLVETRTLVDFFDRCQAAGVLPSGADCVSYGRECAYAPLCSAADDETADMIKAGSFEVDETLRDLSW